MKINKVLIANRAEIAIRIIRTCKFYNIKTVTLYTEEEKDLPQRFEADQSVYLGDGPLKDTYLNIDKIISVAKETGADAIHPGYGFLSENAEFAKKVVENGLIFIGPSVESIILMGDKKGSKEKMIEVGIPTIPGYHGADQSTSTLEAAADSIGYPVLIKASAGGGGKGMRVVYDKKSFVAELESCKREATNSFGSDIVLIEKFIENPRHIEVQVMSDNHGNHFHFFERECSIQRRHQKIIEETPSPALSPELRDSITRTAVQISSAINYSGAGTVEFILDGDKFYFLEMNTRLQVEHPITEEVTGFDLVELQLRAASGEKFDFTQDDIIQTGHSLEVRIYAENPDDNFMPAIGQITKIGEPNYFTRLDTGYRDGSEITVNFDPMIAKVIVHGDTREESIEMMLESLSDLPFFGFATNRDYLTRILTHEKFMSGETYTHFVKTYEEDLKKAAPSDDVVAAAIGALLLNDHKLIENVNSNKSWDSLVGFRNI
ncbi:acetyl/propionyl/methylcrotonyl-CoA carboxylase subunit alpha [Bacteriovorax sp. Seq25_V]|uniref:acetyl-CoA carboxylase biotin carboxylase subunit n=1 Tax=Bacteriovorax sp. Seq25_V TaxID=1201288 RepID=UPI00038A2460|nr:biotin carboxylase N-terminal domain-containing protein [Bacteriovorax sp. Seq25_V]EQC43829.1 ATP-grasp domain protein [Bacteriovorax sp. Seq25_V]